MKSELGGRILKTIHFKVPPYPVTGPVTFVNETDVDMFLHWKKEPDGTVVITFKTKESVLRDFPDRAI